MVHNFKTLITIYTRFKHWTPTVQFEQMLWTNIVFNIFYLFSKPIKFKYNNIFANKLTIGSVK